MLLMLTLLLVGGAIINIAVAWGLAQLPPTVRGDEKASQADFDWLLSTGYERHAFPVARSLGMNVNDVWSQQWGGGAMVFSRNGASWRLVPDGDLRLRGRGFAGVRVQSGWPCLGMEGGWTRTPSDVWSTSQQTQNEFWSIRDALWSEAGVGGRSRVRGVKRPVPLLPMWPGFVVNTLFYAVVLWVMFFALFVLRRRYRVRPGLCHACAYPIGTSDVCTECGAGVSSLLRGEGRELAIGPRD